MLLGLFTPRLSENSVPLNTNGLTNSIASLKPIQGFAKEYTFKLDEAIMKKTVEQTLNKMTRQIYIENGVPQIKFILDFDEEDDWASTAATG